MCIRDRIDAYGTRLKLMHSMILHKQFAIAMGLEKIFVLSPNIRLEERDRDDGRHAYEFTQIDLEMAFVDEDEIMEVVEKLLFLIFKEIKNIEISIPFKRISYSEAIDKFGLDAPDIRFSMQIEDITEIGKASSFKVFREAAEIGVVKGINVEENQKGVDFSVYTGKNAGEYNLKKLPSPTRLIIDIKNSDKKSASELEKLPPQPGDMPHTYADITRAKQLLGWQPTTPLQEGLRAFVQWWRQRHGYA